jgi:hypothetical protein
MDETALESARLKTGLSYRQVERRMIGLLGEHFTPTDQTISRYHQPGKMPRRPEPALLLALCHIYGVEVIDVAPDLADDVERVRELFTPAGVTSRWECIRPVALAA